ncbi:MAG TPA: VOC family protein [Vicinamibacterales bacterium]|nr:VOC family protein [Vicinamibacterales bacterium]
MSDRAWTLKRLEQTLQTMPRPEFRARLKAELEKPMTTATDSRVSVTAYLVVPDAPALIEFVKDVFGASENLPRHVGSGGGVHAEVVIGDTLVMIGGGGPGLSWRGESTPAALHVYVPDIDAAYARAIRAGAASIDAPKDHEYGERGASLKDAFGNMWYVATAKGPHFIPSGMHAVNPSLHPVRSEPLLAFMERALGATDIVKHASPDGVIRYARARIGETVIELGDAHGPYQPMATTFFVNVPDSDAAYHKGVEAGAQPQVEPVDQPYGRASAVRDPFGNVWYFVSPRNA